MTEAKKPVVLLMMHDGAIKDVVCDTRDAVTCVMVNLVSEGSPQEDTQTINLTMKDGKQSGEFTACIRRLNVKHPDTGDTVIDQFLAAAPPDEYDIDHVEHVTIDSRTKKIVRDDGTIALSVGNVTQRFAEAYMMEFGEVPSPATLMKYAPKDE